MKEFIRIMSQPVPAPEISTKKEKLTDDDIRCIMRIRLEKQMTDYVSKFSDMVNVLGFLPEKIYHEAETELSAEELQVLRKNLYDMSQTMIWYFGTQNVWIDGRNEISVRTCRFIAANIFSQCKSADSLPVFTVKKGENKSHLCDAWHEFAKKANTEMHRTNLQTALGFCIWCMMELCPDKSMDTEKKELIQKYGETYWKMPVI